MKTILLIVKIILLIVGLETGYAERSRIFVQASAIFVQASAESNLFGLCRAQPKMSRNRACSYCRAQPKSQRKGQEKCVYMNQCQDKTNPSLVTGLRCKLYTRNPFEYRRLCELVLGWRVLRGNKCVTRARKHISAFSKARPNAHIHAPFLEIFFEIFGCEKSCASRANKITIAEHTAYSQTIQRRNVWNPSCGCKVHCVPLQEQLWGIP